MDCLWLSTFHESVCRRIVPSQIVSFFKEFLPEDTIRLIKKRERKSRKEAAALFMDELIKLSSSSKTPFAQLLLDALKKEDYDKLAEVLEHGLTVCTSSDDVSSSPYMVLLKQKLHILDGLDIYGWISQLFNRDLLNKHDCAEIYQDLEDVDEDAVLPYVIFKVAVKGNDWFEEFLDSIEDGYIRETVEDGIQFKSVGVASPVQSKLTTIPDDVDDCNWKKNDAQLPGLFQAYRSVFYEFLEPETLMTNMPAVFDEFKDEKLQIVKRSGSGHTREAVDIFVKCVITSKSPGKMQMFLEALNCSETKRLHDLIVKGEWFDDENFKKLLNIFGSLMDKVIIDRDFLNYFSDENILGTCDVADIQNTIRFHSKKEGYLLFIGKIQKRETKWFRRLIEALLKNDFEHVAYQLEPDIAKEVSDQQRLVPVQHPAQSSPIRTSQNTIDEQRQAYVQNSEEQYFPIKPPIKTPPPNEGSPSSQDNYHFQNSLSPSKDLEKSALGFHAGEAEGALGGVDNLAAGADSLPDRDPKIFGEPARETLKLRQYQEELATAALDGLNCVLCAPTGSGKTHVAAAITQHHLRDASNQNRRKVIFLVDKVALVNQQHELFSRFFSADYSLVKLSGQDGANRMPLGSLLDENDLFFMTAQILLDALESGEIQSLSMFTLIIFDECHHTDKGHPYNRIMGYYVDEKLDNAFPRLPQIVGMTASLGTGKANKLQKAIEHIMRICSNLDAERLCTIRKHKDELRKHVYKPEERTEKVVGRENDLFSRLVGRVMADIEQSLQDADRRRYSEYPKVESFLKPPSEKGTPSYIQWHSQLHKEVVKLRDADLRRFYVSSIQHLRMFNDALIINDDCRTLDALTFINKEIRIQYSEFFDDRDRELQMMWKRIEPEVEDYSRNPNNRNPKLDRLKTLILQQYGRKSDSRGILFCQTRNLTIALANWMMDDEKLKELNPERFVGVNAPNDQQGITSNQQVDILRYFRDGRHKLIIATTVAEEGIDISKCNYVIRYNHVTNEIALVQARGRGRAVDSNYIVLAQEGKGVAEKEQLNKMREKLQDEAIDKLLLQMQRDGWDRFLAEIQRIQEMAKVERRLERQKQDLSRPTQMPSLGYHLRCVKCDEFACSAEDIRKIEGSHHVVINEDFRTKCKLEPHPRPKFFGEGDFGMTGKLLCRGCGTEWGGTCLYKKADYPVIKISNFIIVDPRDNRNAIKQWKEIPFVVRALTPADLRLKLDRNQERGRGLYNTELVL